jgi:hypothetical protein
LPQELEASEQQSWNWQPVSGPELVLLPKPLAASQQEQVQKEGGLEKELQVNCPTKPSFLTLE